MNKIKALIVDDEYLALDLLEEFISRLPDVELIGRAKNPLEAQEIMNNNEIDLLFLDIQMPVLSGINFTKTLVHQPLIIFTTAYSEHAIEAFDLNAIDYLLKPFTFERFLQAVNKAKLQLKIKSPVTGQLSADKEQIADFISVKSEGKIVRIRLKEITYIESLKEYVIIHGSFGKHIVLERLKNMESQLPEDLFIRVHKSFIVAINKVDTLYGNQLEIGNQRIPISRERKKEVVKRIFWFPKYRNRK